MHMRVGVLAIAMLVLTASQGGAQPSNADRKKLSRNVLANLARTIGVEAVSSFSTSCP
jgi:hypothetical protein